MRRAAGFSTITGSASSGSIARPWQCFTRCSLGSRILNRREVSLLPSPPTLLASGGLLTTPVRTGEQWDAPNGWAPHQWIAVAGLDAYGHGDLARTIATRWIATVTRAYRETGKLLEKYDVQEAAPGGGGEYPLQDGFGWTNGVTRELLERYPQ